MESFLPRGVPSPQDKTPRLLHPSEDLNLTIKKLLDTNSELEDKLEEIEGDKRHFQMKLEEYIRYEREEGSEKVSESPHLERQVEVLTVQVARLKAEINQKEREIPGGASGYGASHFSDRDQRALLLHRINELQTASRVCQDRHGNQIEMLKTENSRLRQEMARMYTTITSSGHSEWRGNIERPSSATNTTTSSGHSDWRGNIERPSSATNTTTSSGHSEWRRNIERPSSATNTTTSSGHSEWRGNVERPSSATNTTTSSGHSDWRGNVERPSSATNTTTSSGHSDWRGNIERMNLAPYHQYQHYSTTGTASGYSSLPESLPSSFPTTGPGAAASEREHHHHHEMPIDITGLTLSSINSNKSTSSDASSSNDALELKKLKRQLEKYKTANIELDQKLKDAKLELRRYSERLGDSDVTYHMDVERCRAENSQLQSRLDRALSDNNYLRGMIARS